MSAHTPGRQCEECEGYCLVQEDAAAADQLRRRCAFEVNYSDTPTLRPFDLEVYGLSENQAYALARLCQRCFAWTMLRGLAGSDQEAKDMALALERVRGGLEQLGVSVS